MEVEIKEYKGSKTIHRATDFDGGYDPINGFYLSSQMFDGDFESDLSRLNLSTLVCNSHYLKHLDDRNTDDIFRIVSLKSLDGTNEMQSCPPKEEKPDMTNRWVTNLILLIALLGASIVAFQTLKEEPEIIKGIEAIN